jgi:hypothetical protein
MIERATILQIGSRQDKRFFAGLVVGYFTDVIVTYYTVSLDAGLLAAGLLATSPNLISVR